jgi:hypothetical protein
MQIITALPRYSDGEIDRALIREITTGIKLKQAWEGEREKICAQHAEKIKDNQKFGFKNLRCLAVTPGFEWFNMRRKYGHEAMHDKGFIKDYQKRFPHLAPNKI